MGGWVYVVMWGVGWVGGWLLLCCVDYVWFLCIQGKGARADRLEEMAEIPIGLAGPPLGCGLRSASTGCVACDVPGTLCVGGLVLVGPVQCKRRVLSV